MVTLQNKLEALLFYMGEPVSRARVASILGVSEDEVVGAASNLAGTLYERGVRLLSVGNEYELVTAPEVSEVITKIRKEELERDLGKAGLETLSIILYRSPVSRAQIEYMRGVNCAFVLRNLLIRGLVSRVADMKNERVVLYAPTADILKYLGVTSVKELPDFETVQKELDAFMHNATETSNTVVGTTP